MNMAKILKNAGIFVLCMAMCLAIAVPSFAAENVAAESSARYFFGSEEAEDFSQVGDYTVKWDVCNYGSEAVTAVILTGKFKGEKLQGVDISDEPKTITTGAKITLEETVTLTEADVEAGVTLESYLWKSTQSLVPVGGGTPDAPTGLEITNVTNSTVDLTWDKDTTGAIESYKLYRNGEELDLRDLTETADGKMSFYDVGIEHNTNVSYTVKAVDFTGKESVASNAATGKTDDIARLWLGAATAVNGASNGTQITDENIEALLEANGGAYNIDVVDVFSGEKGYGDVDTSIVARDLSYEYATNKGLALDCLMFNTNSSRILGVLSSDYMNTLSSDDEVKIVLNYYDNRVVQGVEDVGTTKVNDGTTEKRPSIVFKYASTDSDTLDGTTGLQQTNTNRWLTKIMTIPTSNLTSEAVYNDVYNNIKMAFKTVKSSGVGFDNTNGKEAMFALGSNNKVNSSYFHNVTLQKIDIVPKNYVPYGAVLDFDKQSDTQFVEMLRRDNYNMGAILDVTATATNETKKAITLNNTNEYARLLRVGIGSSYITNSDEKVIIRVTYLDDQVDNTDSAGLTVAWDDQDGGSKTSSIIRRKGTNTWKTAEIPVENAALTNALGSLQIGTGYNTGTNWYISRVEVIKRTK